MGGGHSDELRAAVLTKLNAAKGGGFIFQSDHSVPRMCRARVTIMWSGWCGSTECILSVWESLTCRMSVDDARRRPNDALWDGPRVKPEDEEKYKEYHAAVWPAVLDMIRQCNISQLLDLPEGPHAIQLLRVSRR